MNIIDFPFLISFICAISGFWCLYQQYLFHKRTKCFYWFGIFVGSFALLWGLASLLILHVLRG